MKIIKVIGVVFLLLATTLGVACFVFSHKLPESTPGDAAKTLAAKIEVSVGLQNFYQIPAIAFGFRDRNQHIWDKKRGLSRVVYGKEKDQTEILFHIATRKGIAFHNGERLSGEAETKAVQEGYSRWANDSFWLNPFTKLRDKGVTLSVPNDDPNSLIVAFSSGGVTPGDTYRFYVDANGIPTSCDMWVSVIPVKGANVSWSDWQDVSGAKIAVSHHFSFGVKVYVSDVKAGASAAELNNGVDPFARLLAAEGQPASTAPTSTTTSETPDSAPAMP